MRTPVRALSPLLAAVAVLASWAVCGTAAAQNCPVQYEQLTKALKESVKASGGPSNGGFDNNEWAVVVTRDGGICAVTMSGGKPTDQWLGSRAIAAEKANTANALSLDKTALSTANLYAGAAPGGYLFGLVTTDPPATTLISAGDPKTYGSASDPLVGKHLGGVVVFGGGLALYNQQELVGALGVSGDTSCADHNVAWRVRHALGLDHVPGGVSPDHNDAIIYDMLPDKTSASGYGHPQCGGSEADVAMQIHAGFVPKWAQVMIK
ncbi:MAG TPA: heme-binding protein [Stellaceae bacterium]|nr:heme-binding protein [Stellaceae bacterium]